MIVKCLFNPLKIARYLRTKLLLTVGVSLGAYFLFQNGIARVGLPFSVAAILGSALAIFIVFRNNSAYARWWEASGGKVAAPKMDLGDFGWSAVIIDSEGNKVGLHQNW